MSTKRVPTGTVIRRLRAVGEARCAWWWRRTPGVARGGGGAASTRRRGVARRTPRTALVRNRTEIGGGRELPHTDPASNASLTLASGFSKTRAAVLLPGAAFSYRLRSICRIRSLVTQVLPTCLSVCALPSSHQTHLDDLLSRGGRVFQAPWRRLFPRFKLITASDGEIPLWVDDDVSQVRPPLFLFAIGRFQESLLRHAQHFADLR